DWQLKGAALANPTLKMAATLLGVYMQASGEKAREVLHWSPRSPKEAIVATAESMLQLGLIKK
ncbi:MAG: aldehyde reductase, partial [Williamsia sp.]|nr:aldehyde reductase [Williamsia sp.]